MLDTLLTVLPVFLVILGGFGACRGGLVSAEAGGNLSHFVAWIALPCLMFHLGATTDWAAQWDGGFVIASVVGSIGMLGIGMVIGRRRGLGFADMAVDGLNASYSNTAYLGLPLFLMAIGPQSAPYILVAATLTLMLLFTSAVLLIEYGHNRHRGLAHALGKAVLGVIRNPILGASLIGVAVWAAGITVPAFLAEPTRMLGATASPVALFSIGVFLAGRSLVEAMRDPFVLSLAAAKLLLHPALTALLVYGLLDLPPFPALMAVMIAALPTGTGPFMVAALYARDGRVTSGAIFLSTLLSPLSVALLLAILPR